MKECEFISFFLYLSKLLLVTFSYIYISTLLDTDIKVLLLGKSLFSTDFNL